MVLKVRHKRKIAFLGNFLAWGYEPKWASRSYFLTQKWPFPWEGCTGRTNLFRDEKQKFFDPFDIVGLVLKVRYKRKIAFLGDFLAALPPSPVDHCTLQRDFLRQRL